MSWWKFWTWWGGESNVKPGVVKPEPAAEAVRDVEESWAGWHAVMGSSFADPADVRAFERCKRQGKSDKECFKVGDNGVGCWGDVTAQEHTPMCALPPEDLLGEWGSLDKAKRQKVRVRSVKTGREVVCLVGDRMPWRKNIKNGAGIDLNPAAAKALGLKPPFMEAVRWKVE